MTEYNGPERRHREVRMENDDHDVLTSVSVNVTNIANDLTAFMEKFDEHTKEDKLNLEKIDDRIGEVKKYVFIGVGILIALKFASQFISLK